MKMPRIKNVRIESLKKEASRLGYASHEGLITHDGKVTPKGGGYLLIINSNLKFMLLSNYQKLNALQVFIRFLLLMARLSKSAFLTICKKD